MSTFISVWESIFGVYEPIQCAISETEYVYMTDWGYVSKVGFFILCFYCFLRLIGGAIHGK